MGCEKHPGAREVERHDGTWACIGCIFSDTEDPNVYVYEDDEDDN